MSFLKRKPTASERLTAQMNRYHTPFELSESFLNLTFGATFMICALVSGLATFNGVFIYLAESASTSIPTKGFAVVITIAIMAILVVGWGALTRFAPESPNMPVRLGNFTLAAIFTIITLCVSSVSGVNGLIGVSAKQFDLKQQHQLAVIAVNETEARARATEKVMPLIRAERDRACNLEQAEISRGVSGSGRGVGPIAIAFASICSQSSSFLTSIEDSRVVTAQAVREARFALGAMRVAIRAVEQPMRVRENAFVDAGDALNVAMQTLRAADLLETLRAGASQIQASITELGASSAFSPLQVEMVGALKDGMGGLIEATEQIAAESNGVAAPGFNPIATPDYLEAIYKHAIRYVPVVVAVVAIDLFCLFSMLFMMNNKAGSRVLRAREQKRLEAEVRADRAPETGEDKGRVVVVADAPQSATPISTMVKMGLSRLTRIIPTNKEG